MATATSASRTKGASRSAAEYTAMARTPRRRAVPIMRRAISPRLAMSKDSSMRLHPEKAELRARGDRLVQSRREREPKDIAGLRRIDDAVVPETCSGIVGIALRLVAGAHRLLEGRLLLRRPCFIAGLHGIPLDGREHRCRLFA